MAKTSRTAKPPKPPRKTGSKKEEPKDPQEIVVEYDLFELPTAFHKAGLAGLVLLIESLKQRNVLAPHEVKCQVSPTTATIYFTEHLLKLLMDDLYDAKPVEVNSKSKWQGAEVKRQDIVEEEQDGKKLKVKTFVYEVVQPKGLFFERFFDGEKQLWLKLWRDMLWNIPRSRPTTREPFNQRSKNQSCKEGPNAWADLLKMQKARNKNEFYMSDLSSALFPGAQAVNAEGVPFEGRVEQNLLLHFWPLTVLLFVPQRIDVGGKTDFAGYTLAVPEVANLTEFIHDYPILLDSLTKDARGYRPAQAVIDLPAEAGLMFMEHLVALTSQSIESSALRFSIRSVEYLHLVKEGNNVKAMTAGRVSPSKDLLHRYHEIVNPKQEQGQFRYRNPLFRRGLLQALLSGSPWYQPFGPTLAVYDAELFIRQSRKSEDAEQKGPPQFANDVSQRFRQDATQYAKNLERSKSMPDIERPTAPLSVIVNRVVRSYLLVRASEKSNTNLDHFKTGEDLDWSKVPSEFNEAKHKLAEALMYEFRSRKDRAFVDHFATTFFSVTQRFAEAERLKLAEVLTSDGSRDDLKTLTLLALSANS